MGSCFSDTIGARLTEFKVATLVNPFGTVFNPISACKLLRAAAGEDMDWQQHLVEARGRWQSYDLHAGIGADSPVELLQHIQRLIREVGVFLATADVVVLTLGSAYAYRLRETDELVSNCHKIPAEKFDKELLTADEIIAAVAETHAYLRRLNPKLRFVLTVSPVRHLKDTLVLNSASKAMLRVACHYLSELLPEVTYFPAYELLVDDLRDYRFYATDMLHLSETAENYVWERFTRSYFDAAFGRFKKEWEGIRQNLNHRPLYPAGPEHREFLEDTLERLRKLSGQADVRMELLHVERELANLPGPAAPALPAEPDYDDGEERIDVGSFDEETALEEAQPIVSSPVVAATATPTDSPAAPSGTPKQEQAATPPRLASQARLLRPGAGILVEDVEDDSLNAPEDAAEAAVSADLAYDHAYSPTAGELTAASAEDEDTDGAELAGEESTAEGAAETAEETARRKKRRSRGGAKRTKRKHARLAAEQAGAEGQSEVSVATTASAPVPDEPLPEAETASATVDESASEVIYVTEAELRHPRPRPATSAPAEAEARPELEPAAGVPENAESPAEAPATRRSRNNRRGNKREQPPRYGGRPLRQPLYAPDAAAPAPEAPAAELPAAAPNPTDVPTPVTVELATSQLAASIGAGATEPVAAATPEAPPAALEAETTPTATATPAPAGRSAAKQRANKPTPRKPAVETATPAIIPAAASVPEPPAPETATTTEDSGAKAASKKPVRRKPAAKLVTEPTQETNDLATPPADPAAPATETTVPVTPALAATEAAGASTSAKKRTVKPKTAAKPKATTKPKALTKPAAAPAKTKTSAVATDVPAAVVPEPKRAAKPKAAPKPRAATNPKAPADTPNPATEDAAPAASKAPPKIKASAKPQAKPAAKKKASPDTPAPEDI